MSNTTHARYTQCSVLSTTLCITLAIGVCASGAIAANALIQQTDVFTAGAEGYHSYRIPVLFVAKNGTLLAICEGRKTGRGDHGDVDLVQKRSSDGGKTWGHLELIYEEGG